MPSGSTRRRRSWRFDAVENCESVDVVKAELDRTDEDSHYGSGKLFRFLGPHLVNDHIHLHVKIHADRER